MVLCDNKIIGYQKFNSLTAIDTRERQLFDKLLNSLTVNVVWEWKTPAP